MKLFGMRTPKNIKQHELIGLECEIVLATNKSQIGVKGRIIDETLKTLLLKTEKGRKQIPKKGTVFRIRLHDKKVDVQGDGILARPEDRIKKKLKKW